MFLLSDQSQVGTKETIRINYRPAFSTFNFELSTCSTTAISASLAHPSDAPSPHPSGATRSNWLSAQNTTSLAGPHRRSASTAGYVSILPPAGSSSLGPAAEKSCQRSGKLKPAKRKDSTPPRNRSDRDPAALASPSRGWKTTSSRFDRFPCGY